MNRYLKLVHMEVRRFQSILFGLMALTLLIQSTALVWKSLNEVSRYRESGASFKGEPPFSFAFAVGYAQFWFAIPVLISIVILGIYVFWIWYRDWYGRDTFAYRLLTLPTARRNVYLAKATAILLFVFSMVAFQLLLLPVEKLLFNLVVPSEYREPSGIAEAVNGHLVFERLIPLDISQFLVSYGLGIIAVFAVFTAILLERSYRWRGVLYGALYLVACLTAFFYPLLTLGPDGDDRYLHPGETLAIMIGICVVVLAASIALGFRLISRKITV